MTELVVLPPLDPELLEPPSTVALLVAAVFWLVLAFLVAVEITYSFGSVLTHVESWVGGVLSLYMAQTIYRLVRYKRRVNA